MSITIACLSTYISPEELATVFAPDGAHIITVPAPPQPKERLIEAVSDADLVIAGGHHKIDAELIAAMTRCRLIQFPGAGVDTIDQEAAARKGIPVAAAPGLNRDAVAEWTLMAILNLVRRGAWSDRHMREGSWAKVVPLPPDLAALTVGVVGLGNIGTAVATRVLVFGSRVIFYDPLPRRLAGAEPVSFQRLLSESDVVTLHMPLETGTRHLVGRTELQALKPGAILVNAARGPVLDEVAALEALRSGRLAGLGLDVFETEPLPAESPLRREENVFLTAHIAGSSLTAMGHIRRFVAENLRRAAAGERPLAVVNRVGAGQAELN